MRGKYFLLRKGHAKSLGKGWKTPSLSHSETDNKVLQSILGGTVYSWWKKTLQHQVSLSQIQLLWFLDLLLLPTHYGQQWGDWLPWPSSPKERPGCNYSKGLPTAAWTSCQRLHVALGCYKNSRGLVYGSTAPLQVFTSQVPAYALSHLYISPAENRTPITSANQVCSWEPK